MKKAGSNTQTPVSADAITNTIAYLLPVDSSQRPEHNLTEIWTKSQSIRRLAKV